MKNKKKKILINYLGRNNAGPVIAWNMAKGLAEAGYSVYAVLADSISNRKLWDSSKWIEEICYVHTYSNKCEFVLSSLSFFLFKKYKIKKFFKNIEFDFIINPMHHFWSCTICELFSESSIVTLCHDPNPHKGEKKFETKRTQRLMRMSKDIFVLSKCFIPVVKEKYSMSEKHIHYMPLGRMNYNTFDTASEKRKGNFYSSDKVNFLFFGRIEDYKGLDVLANAYEEVYKYNQNITLTIAGNGNFSRYQEAYNCLNNVKIVNKYIPDEEVIQYFKGENIVTIIPYTTATQSGVIPIALEYGTIIIASSTGGLLEQLNDGKIGYLFETGNAVDLANKMQYVITHKDEWEMQRKLMKEHMERLSWNNLMKEFMQKIEKEEVQ